MLVITKCLSREQGLKKPKYINFEKASVCSCSWRPSAPPTPPQRSRKNHIKAVSTLKNPVTTITKTQVIQVQSHSLTASQRGREFGNVSKRCQDQGCWLVSVYMWTQLTEGNCYGCIHIDPAHLQHHHPTPAAQFCVLYILYHHQGQK